MHPACLIITDRIKEERDQHRQRYIIKRLRTRSKANQAYVFIYSCQPDPHTACVRFEIMTALLRSYKRRFGRQTATSRTEFTVF